MAAGETGKDLAARIPYDYPVEPDRQVRQRLVVTAVFLAGCAAFLAWGFLAADSGRRQVSRGPVARAHATWDTQCDACHVPLSTTRWDAGELSFGVASDAGDQKCKTCHMGHESQVHHASQASSKTPHCAECHREHNGPEASLVRRDEAQCTDCHADLGSALAFEPRLKEIARNIKHSYDGSHPEFRSAKSDPGRLKFNHALHMSPGLNPVREGQAVFTFRQLPSDSDRRRYGWIDGQSLDAPVTLECASCHVRDAGDFVSGTKQEFTGRPPTVPALPSSLFPERARGAYMMPVTYEFQCAACHPLDAPGPLSVRHRLQPPELHDSLRAGYIALALKSRSQSNGAEEDPARRIPWRESLDSTERDGVERSVATAERVLYGPGKGTCTECHHYEGSADAPVRATDGRIDAAKTAIAPTSVPTVWLEHGRFDHSAHRAVDCRVCHAAAYSDGAGVASTVSTDVLIPQRATCVECHAPRRRAGGKSVGGADSSCVECHSYHNGDHAWQGRGALARGVVVPSDVSEFLQGRSPDRPQRTGHK
jgi:predicted CXXCH cytochrome family protein